MLPAHAGMVPGRALVCCCSVSAPRARGDGPRNVLMDVAEFECSPRTRGWSHHRPGPDGRARVLPAHAGMVPATRFPPQASRSASRARGDGPVREPYSMTFHECSPRTRGWSPAPRRPRVADRVLPAHAGMVLVVVVDPRGDCGAPRARGDGPRRERADQGDDECSPRTRGWSVPARCRSCPGTRRAPRARGDGPTGSMSSATLWVCSPRTRGWSHHQGDERLGDVVLPAHAGMVPGRASRRRVRSSAPRARGDGPPRSGNWRTVPQCSPRTRGWSRAPRGPLADLVGAPRARGDGPPLGGSMPRRASCSPRTRGWSQEVTQWPRNTGVLPAHAGMVPRLPVGKLPTCCAPRARGDGPAQGHGYASSGVCSPRTRGWSPGMPRPGSGAPVLPAHAGMVPGAVGPGRPASGAPRARGDGPTSPSGFPSASRCSPRTRGWSRLQPVGRGVPHVLPAHAGMVPG